MSQVETDKTTILSFLHERFTPSDILVIDWKDTNSTLMGFTISITSRNDKIRVEKINDSYCYTLFRHDGKYHFESDCYSFIDMYTKYLDHKSIQRLF